MFNKDFYPTPTEVIIQMIGNLDLNGKVVLEPSAGKGDIVDALKKAGAKVLICEMDENLAKISGSKADRFLNNDFLNVKSEDISHIDYIFMNPPFSKDEDHILHAWTIAPGGCQVVALCNWETINNPRYTKRLELASIVEAYGHSENLGDCFSDSERKTNVEVGLINLFKAKEGEDEFEGFFDMNDEEEKQGEGIISYNEIRDIVNRYVGSVKMFDEVMIASNRINEMSSIFNFGSIKFGAYSTDSNNTNSNIDRDVYKKDLQKAAWKEVFSKMKMDKYVTKKLKEGLNKFVEKQHNVPFTMTNVYKMIEMVIGTHGNRMDSSLVDLFENVTKHYHDNRYNIEGWKTNTHYMINKTIILPRVTEMGYKDQMTIGWANPNVELMQDLCKGLCYILGENYDTNCTSLEEALVGTPKPIEYYQTEEYRESYGRRYDDLKRRNPDAKVTREQYIDDETQRNFEKGKVRDYTPWGKWFDWNFFEVRGYKKGTMHFKFKNEKVWETLNRRIGEIKGWDLPESI